MLLSNEESHINPLVSIIVPVYNSENMISHTISSILAQTYTNIELILINDGSTDTSGEICVKYADQDSRIVYINQENCGIAGAQNAGLRVMKGEYVSFCDGDDLYHREYVSRLLSMLIKDNADIATCRWHNIGQSRALYLYNQLCKNINAGNASHANSVNKVSTFLDEANSMNTLQSTNNVSIPNFAEMGVKASYTYTDAFDKYQNVHSVFSRKLRKNGEYEYLNEANWSKLYKTSLFVGIEFPDGHFGQDISISPDLYLKADKVVSTLEKLYFWVQHSDSTSHSNKSLEFHTDIFEASYKSYVAAVENNITPARSYYMLYLEYNTFLNKKSVPTKYRKNFKKKYKMAIAKLSLTKHINCIFKAKIRLFETFIYKLTLHRQK